MSPRSVHVQCLCSLLALAPICSSFVHNRHLSIRIGRQQHDHAHDNYSILLPVGMGGYYAEPESTRAIPGQHMIFGIPCIEETMMVVGPPALLLKNLLPVSEEEGGRSASDSDRSRLFQYLVDHVDFENKSVVEIGATGVSIAAALAWGASSVLVCHPDSNRLRLWEHSLQFFNEVSVVRPCQVCTKTFSILLLETDAILQNADIVVITLAMSQQDDATSMGLLSLAQQALRNGSRVIMIAPEDGQIMDQQYETPTPHKE